MISKKYSLLPFFFLFTSFFLFGLAKDVRAGCAIPKALCGTWRQRECHIEPVCDIFCKIENNGSCPVDPITGKSGCPQQVCTYYCDTQVGASEVSCIVHSDNLCYPSSSCPNDCYITTCTSSATPTPPPGGGGGGGNTCNGECFATDNCIIVGRNPGSGTCGPGQICCGAPRNDPVSCGVTGLAPSYNVKVGETITISPYIFANGSGVDPIYSSSSNTGKVTISPSVYESWSCGIAAFVVNPPGGYVGFTVEGKNVTQNPVQVCITAARKKWSTPECQFDRCCTFYCESFRWPGSIPTQCTQINVTAPGPWWQAQDADITAGGNLSSSFPANTTLILDGPGGYPGVASYGGSTTLTPGQGNGTVSSQGWLANSTYGGRTYTFAYFQRFFPDPPQINILPSDTILGADLTSGGVEDNGYVWYKREGNLTINGDMVIPSNRKVILLVSGGSLSIKGNISVQNPGQGLFVALVGKTQIGEEGNIQIDPAVTSIRGVLFADTSISTGMGNTQLTITGSVAAPSVSLQRDLGPGNGNTPAEFFVYDPTLGFTLPRNLHPTNVVWREVNP